MNEVYPLEAELNLFTPGTVHFRRDAFDELVLELDGQETAGVRIQRGFPHSAASRMLSVRGQDREELGIIADINDLDDASRQTVDDELEKAYFIPRIVRVLAIEEHFHVPCWEVETDRGPRRFEIRSGHRDVRVVGNRILIRDADGNQYVIPDYRRLDADSQTLIESQV